jgi:hypothetical protein
MTRNLILSHPEFIYTRMQGLVWIANEGLGPNFVQPSASESLCRIVRECSPERPLLVNFRGIVDIGNYALASLQRTLRAIPRTLVVINGTHLHTRLIAELGDPTAAYSHSDTIVFGGLLESPTAGDLVAKSLVLEQDYVKQIVYKSFKKREKPDLLHSTPLTANGSLDARRIVSAREHFIWLSLLLADRLECDLERLEGAADALGAQAKGLPSSILAVSLRACPFAAAVGLLSPRNLEVVIVDHMGPKYELLEDYYFSSMPTDVNFVYVGDFLLGGTELKTAQLYARSRHCRVSHALVIGCWLRKEAYERNARVSVLSLSDLRTCRPDATIEFA